MLRYGQRDRMEGGKAGDDVRKRPTSCGCPGRCPRRLGSVSSRMPETRAGGGEEGGRHVARGRRTRVLLLAVAGAKKEGEEGGPAGRVVRWATPT